jgi:hypothetical protein
LRNGDDAKSYLLSASILLERSKSGRLSISLMFSKKKRGKFL